MQLALVLGGGSLRGAAHLGVLQVLEEEGIKPDLVVGTSAGAIVAALWATGLTAGESMLLLEHHRASLWPDPQTRIEIPATGQVHSLGLLPLGLIPGAVLEKALKLILKDSPLSRLSRAVAIVATDLYRGQTVVYSNLKPATSLPGFEPAWANNVGLHEAARASIAIPGIFTPKALGQRTLVDGGVVDNVPADVARLLGATKVIAVDLGFGVYKAKPFNNVIQVLLQTFEIMGHRVSDTVLANYADLVLRPQLDSANLWDFHKIPGFIKAGAATARACLPDIKALLAAPGS